MLFFYFTNLKHVLTLYVVKILIDNDIKTTCLEDIVVNIRETYFYKHVVSM